MQSPASQVSLALCAGVVCWLGAVGFGLIRLADYEFATEAAEDPRTLWPVDTTLPRDRTKATLIMFAHPHCPCSRASVGELALLMARVSDRLTARVVFLKPAHASDDWEKSALRRSAAGIPGVSVAWDHDGVEARRFGAATSGHVFLYSVAGRLLFNGGITGSRGHSGDNVGRSSVVALVGGGRVGSARSPVFGCSLRAPTKVR